MSDESNLASRAISLTVVLLLMLAAPVMISRCNQQAGSSDLGIRDVLIKPPPTSGGPEAQLLRGGVSAALQGAPEQPLAKRLQIVRNACASLPALERGDLGRLDQADARALGDLLRSLPYRDIVQRIEWAKPIIGSDTHFQEVLMSGGQGLGVFKCTDELSAAVAWSLAGSATSGWPEQLEECRRWGNYCVLVLSDRLRVHCRDVDVCAAQMRWAEIHEMRKAFEKPVIGMPSGDPFVAARNPTLARLIERISQAKLDQNPG